MADLVTALMQRIAQGAAFTSAPKRRRLLSAPVMTFVLVGLVATWYFTRFSDDPRTRTGLKVTVIDGDSFRSGNETYRLVDIDTPELRQTCKDARGADWSCGTAARDRLIALTLRGAVSCKDRGRDRYGRIVALCSGLAASDFGETLVREGLALDYGRGAGTYFKAEREAREFKRGLWAGSFDRPEDWRRKHATAQR
jgi:endonuclease YncB( thermonuclease family)